ncbi:TMEM175 family protein [Streptomyces sp. NPDC059477]|uniref:TMEM175 family protein n=1 Tax=Streptomyces sp. NPDC059477 TaxID=3346847 RepID=UPI0036AC896D
MNHRSSGAPHRAAPLSPERLAAFGDGVFAIAITLLALDITVPDGLPEAEVAGAVQDALPAIGSYLLSFAVIGTVWRAQHGLFRLIARVDHWLLYTYFALLAVVAALPFPTRLISEYGSTVTATTVYAGAITLAAALRAAMYARLLAAPALTAPHSTPARLKEALRDTLLLALVFGTSIPVAFLSPTAAKYWWLLAVPARLLSRTPGPGGRASGKPRDEPVDGPPTL